MCFRPATLSQIDHKCPECGTNNLPEATMCARCFAPLEAMTEEMMRAQLIAKGVDVDALAAGAPGTPAAPKAPAAPAAPAAPKAPAPPTPAPAAAPAETVTFSFGGPSSFGGFGGNDDGAVYF